METALAIIAGAVWGAAWGAGKYLLLWRPLFTAADARNRVGAAIAGNLLADALVLLTPYLLRNVLPFPLIPCLIAAAVALSVCGRWPVLFRARRAQTAEAAAENGVSVIVLDRPNPNGYFVDGPVLDPKFKSFVGMHPVPVVHGMTIGEYARMVNGEGWLANGVVCDLTVVPMSGYTHSTRYSLPVAPSPNLQTDEAIYLYPSLCLFEGTAISVGRGTPTPFQVFGHPSLKAGDFHFTPKPIKGVSENPPQKGLDCRGYDLSAYARQMLDSANCFSIKYVQTAFENFPQNQTEFFTNSAFFDKLAGTDQLRKQILAHQSEAAIRASWQPQLDEFKQVRKKYLLYPDFE